MKRQIIVALAKRILLPGLAGLTVGLAAVFWLMRPNLPVVAAPEPVLYPVNASLPDRVTVLILDGDDKKPVGVWQWWAQPKPAGCLVSDNQVIQPQGRTAGEIIELALERGDDSWVALATDTLAAACGDEIDGGFRQVLFVQSDGLRSLIAAAGGIELGGKLHSARETWRVIANRDGSAGKQREQSLGVWLGLASATQKSERSLCEIADPHDDWFRAFPPRDDSCKLFEQVMRQKPAVIQTP